MSFLDAFNTLEQSLPHQSSDSATDNIYSSSGISNNGTSYEPTYTPITEPNPMASIIDPYGVSNWEQEFVAIKSTPILYNMDGMISPYASNNWGGTSQIIKSLDDTSRLPSLVDKVDPNRIFNSDINSLRAIASDQAKITKMFEKKLVEGLTEKGKVGLTENDIMAMQAVTTARNALTSINKEQIAIKKNIADIRIKQQEKSNAANKSDTGVGGATNPYGKSSAADVGRSILDSIFESNGSMMNPIPDNNTFTSASAEEANRMLDSLIPTTTPSIQFEAVKPTTYVVVGDTDNDVEFVTYDSDGNLIPDYPNPTAKIETIDRDTKTASDELLVQYPLMFK